MYPDSVLPNRILFKVILFLFLLNISSARFAIPDDAEIRQLVYSGEVDVKLLHQINIPDGFGELSNRPRRQLSRSFYNISYNSDKCVSFKSIFSSSMEYLSTTCAAAVDYPFFLPANTSLYELETAARNKLENIALTALPPTCLVSLTKLVCSLIYLKCVPNVVIGKSSTYSTAIYSNYPLPFQRPCASVCSNANNICYGVLTRIGYTYNCGSDTTNYSGGKITTNALTYDQSNNAAVCNSVTATFSIANPVEPYVGSVCKGIADVAGPVYILPASFVDPQLAPLQAPGVIQSIIESKLVDAGFPLWLTRDCNFAFKKYICRSVLPRSTYESFQTAFTEAGVSSFELSLLPLLGVNPSILSVNVYYPSFPSFTICKDYARICNAFIVQADRPETTPNCFAQEVFGSNAVSLYPNTTQTIASFSFPISLLGGTGSTVTINFRSAPDTESGAINPSYNTSCPQGFVVPDDPEDPRTVLIPGTGCAVACRFPVNTDSEYNTIDRWSYCLQIIGIILTSLVIIVYLLVKKRREEHTLVMVFALFALVLSASMATVITGDVQLCANNAVSIDASDGTGSCVLSAYVNIYCLQASIAARLLYSVDRYLKVVKGVSNTRRLFSIYMSIIVLFPLLIVLGVASTGIAGYDAGPKVCFISPSVPNIITSIEWILAPGSLLGVISTFLISYAGYIAFTEHRRDISSKSLKRLVNLQKSEKTSSSEASTFISRLTKSSTRPSKQEVRHLMDDVEYDHSFSELMSTMLFNSVISTLSTISFFYTIYALVLYNQTRDSFSEWATCAFTYFNGDDEYWHNICGSHLELRPSYALEVTSLLFASGIGAIFGLFSLLNPALWEDVVEQLSGLNDDDTFDDIDSDDIEVISLDQSQYNSLF